MIGGSSQQREQLLTSNALPIFGTLYYLYDCRDVSLVISLLSLKFEAFQPSHKATADRPLACRPPRPPKL